MTDKNDPSAVHEATLEAENCLIGAILINSDGDEDRKTINAVVFIVNPKDFWDFDERYPVNNYQCQNGRIYSAMLTCKGSPHIVNVAKELVTRGLLKSGDLSHLSHCTAICPMSLDWQDYAVSVRYYSQLRKSIKGGNVPQAEQVRGGVTLEPM